MSNKKTKRVYSKPIQVEKPVEEKSVTSEPIIADLNLTAEKPVKPVEETLATSEPESTSELNNEVKEFVEEFPEFTSEVVEEEIKIEPHIEGEKIAEVLEQYHNVDAQTEIEKVLQTEISGEQLSIDAAEELKKELETPAIEYFLTEKQIEEGAQIVADMVNDQILNELKALAPEPPKAKTLASLSNAELRHFHRTGQMPR
ncbi:MAG: hypothetical protein WC428_00785 [Candidatus Paceibacterota bacterium]